MRNSKREEGGDGGRDERRRSRQRSREARKRREELERKAREATAQAPVTKAEPAAKPKPATEPADTSKQKIEPAAKAKKTAKPEEPKKAEPIAKSEASKKPKPKRAAGTAREVGRRLSLPALARPLRSVGRVAGRGLGLLAFALLRLAAQIEKVLTAVIGFLGPVIRRLTESLGRLATPPRVAAAVAIGAGLAAIASQAVDYRAIAIGEAAYADVSSLAQAPLTGQETPWGAHGPLVGLLALAACVGSVLALLRNRPRAGQIALGAAAFALILILAVDLPRAGDTGAAADEYAGTDGVLLKGFYIQLSALLVLLFTAALPWVWRLRLPSLASPPRRRGGGASKTAPAERPTSPDLGPGTRKAT